MRARPWTGLMVLAAAICGQACSASDHGTPRATGSPGAFSRSSAVRASRLTGEIAYGGRDGHLWIIDAKTGTRRQVTHAAGGMDFDPHWSPDGGRLVFRSSRFRAPDPSGIGLDGILIVNRDGTNEHLISGTSGGLFPAWSPDGTTIVYSTSFDQGPERLAAYDLASSRTRDLGIYGEGVAWSPDGSLALVGREQRYLDGAGGSGQNWEIWRARGDFANFVRLTDNASDDYFGGWSPDHSLVLFTTKRRDAGDVWLMQADGSHPHAVIAWDGNQAAGGFLGDGRMLFSDNLGSPSWYLLSPRKGTLEHVDLLAGIDGPVAWRAGSAG